MRPSLYITIACAFTLALPSSPARAYDPKPTEAQANQALVKLDYSNAEVADVIRALAAQSRINIAMSPGVKGQITVHIRNKTVEEALAVVTNLASLSYRKVGDTYLVGAKTEMKSMLDQRGVKRTVELSVLTTQQAMDLANNGFEYVTARAQGNSVVLSGAQEDVDEAAALIKRSDIISPEKMRVSEKVPVKNRPASQIAATLMKMVPNISVESLGTAVVITGAKNDVAVARNSVELIDVAGNPETEIRVYQVRYASPSQLVTFLERAAPDVSVIVGPDSHNINPIRFSPLSGIFAGSTGSSGGTGGGSGQGGAMSAAAGGAAPSGGPGQPGVNDRALALVLRGPRESLEEAFRVLSLVDVAPKQMLIEARVIDASPEATSNIGVQWEWNKFQFVERPGLGQTPPATVPGLTGLPLGPLGFGNFGRIQFNPLATLNAMVTSKQARLLASPQIAVLNDQDASIFIGDTLRFQSLALSGPNTGNQFTVMEVPVGIILLVHPRVNDEGNITLRVHPVVSTLTAITDGLPQTSSREAETIVRVKDGDTIVIGGLIRDEDTKQMSKIPLLGDLPILGHLFRNESRTKRRSEVTVFLTIKLIS